MQALVQNEFTPLLEGSRLLQLKDFIELDYSDYPDQSKQFSEWLVDFQWPYFFVPKYPATIDGNTATQLIVAPAQFFSVLGSNSSSSTYMSPRIPQ